MISSQVNAQPLYSGNSEQETPRSHHNRVTEHSLKLLACLLQMPDLQSIRNDLERAQTELRSGETVTLSSALGSTRHQLLALLPQGVGQKILSLSCESSRGLFGQGLLELASRFEEEQNLPTTGQLLSLASKSLAGMSGFEASHQQALHRLEVLNGGGGIADQVQMFARSLPRELQNGSMLAGMMAAGVANPMATRVIGRWIGASARKGVQLALANAGGIVADGFAFEAASRGVRMAQGQRVDSFTEGLGRAYWMIGNLRVMGLIGKTISRSSNFNRVLTSVTRNQKPLIHKGLHTGLEYGGIYFSQTHGDWVGIEQGSAPYAWMQSAFTLCHFKTAGASLRAIAPGFSALTQTLQAETTLVLRNGIHSGVRRLSQWLHQPSALGFSSPLAPSPLALAMGTTGGGKVGTNTKAAPVPSLTAKGLLSFHQAKGLFGDSGGLSSERPWKNFGREIKRDQSATFDPQHLAEFRLRRMEEDLRVLHGVLIHYRDTLSPTHARDLALRTLFGQEASEGPETRIPFQHEMIGPKGLEAFDQALAKARRLLRKSYYEEHGIIETLIPIVEEAITDTSLRPYLFNGELLSYLIKFLTSYESLATNPSYIESAKAAEAAKGRPSLQDVRTKLGALQNLLSLPKISYRSSASHPDSTAEFQLDVPGTNFHMQFQLGGSKQKQLTLKLKPKGDQDWEPIQARRLPLVMVEGVPILLQANDLGEYVSLDTLALGSEGSLNIKLVVSPHRIPMSKRFEVGKRLIRLFSNNKMLVGNSRTPTDVPSFILDDVSHRSTVWTNQAAIKDLVPNDAPQGNDGLGNNRQWLSYEFSIPVPEHVQAQKTGSSFSRKADGGKAKDLDLLRAAVLETSFQLRQSGELDHKNLEAFGEALRAYFAAVHGISLNSRASLEENKNYARLLLKDFGPLMVAMTQDISSSYGRDSKLSPEENQVEVLASKIYKSL